MRVGSGMRLEISISVYRVLSYELGQRFGGFSGGKGWL